MTQPSSRKQFFAKLAGAAAVLGVSSKLFAKSAAVVESVPAPAPAENKLPVVVRADARAVARRSDSI